MIIENCIPYTLEYRLGNRKVRNSCLFSGHINRAGHTSITSIDPKTPMCVSIKIPFFNWCEPVDINSKTPPELLRIVCFTIFFFPLVSVQPRHVPHDLTCFTQLDMNKRTLIIQISNIVTPEGTRKISFYAQYWMINKTGSRLLFRRAGLDGSLAAGQTVESDKCQQSLSNSVDLLVRLSIANWKWVLSVSDLICTGIQRRWRWATVFVFSSGVRGRVASLLWMKLTVSRFRIDPRGDLASVMIDNSVWSESTLEIRS